MILQRLQTDKQISYWLLKFSPALACWQDILRTGKFEIYSVRNAQARNNLKAMKLGDEVLFYHSQKDNHVLGVMKVVEEAHQDITTDDPRWVSVTFEPVKSFERPVSLSWMKEQPELQKIPLITQPRLSVMPLTSAEYGIIYTAFDKKLRQDAENISGIRLLFKELIARFYPFTEDQILEHAETLASYAEALTYNTNIQWSERLLERFKYCLPWRRIFQLQGLVFDEAFFKRYASFIDYTSIWSHKNIVWSEAILDQCSPHLNWNQVIGHPFFAREEILRQHEDVLDWKKVSRAFHFNIAPECIDKFADKLDWDALSCNEHLPLSVPFIQKHVDRLNFDRLSQNPAALPYIYKYPQSKRWNWLKVIQNPAIVYDEPTYKYILYYFKKYLEAHQERDSIWLRIPEKYFFRYLFLPCRNDVSYFLNEKFIDLLPKDCLSYSSAYLTKEFFQLVYNRGLVDWNDLNTLHPIAKIVDKELVTKHFASLDSKNRGFYSLPFTQKLYHLHKDIFDLQRLSSSIRFDWDLEFIIANWEKLNPAMLKNNKGVYRKLLGERKSGDEILELLA
jgi:predicted RNA-binding protein with PUA-like domain